jgi:hypothetical protein
MEMYRDGWKLSTRLIPVSGSRSVDKSDNIKIKEGKIMKRFQKVLRSEKADEPRTFLLSRITFAICFFVSVGLVVGGFFVPPMGVIDGSCLTAVGELLLFPTILYAYRAIELGLTVKFNHGDTSIEITKREQADIDPIESDAL